jgi:hypothetical protein
MESLCEENNLSVHKISNLEAWNKFSDFVKEISKKFGKCPNNSEEHRFFSQNFERLDSVQTSAKCCL